MIYENMSFETFVIILIISLVFGSILQRFDWLERELRKEEQPTKPKLYNFIAAIIFVFLLVGFLYLIKFIYLNYL